MKRKEHEDIEPKTKNILKLFQQGAKEAPQKSISKEQQITYI
jgi:hypothetical protein